MQKREKREWLCKRPSNINHVQQYCAEPKTKSANATPHHALMNPGWNISEQRQAIAVAEDAVATAQAAVEIVRLGSRPSNYANVREQYAAIVIQTAFRGYLVSENNILNYY